MNNTGSKVVKFMVIVFVLILAYLLLVYYKGGTTYVGNLTSGFVQGVHALQGSGTKPAGYATGG